MKKGGLYVLGHVTKGDLSGSQDDPVTKVILNSFEVSLCLKKERASVAEWVSKIIVEIINEPPTNQLIRNSRFWKQ